MDCRAKEWPWAAAMWEGVALSIEIEDVLFSENTKYQKVEVFKTKTCGNMLVLDGIIQATEMDEFAYQEMMAHLPMFAHPAPKDALVVGGGDGGVLRELAFYARQLPPRSQEPPPQAPQPTENLYELLLGVQVIGVSGNPAGQCQPHPDKPRMFLNSILEIPERHRPLHGEECLARLIVAMLLSAIPLSLSISALQ